MKRALLVAGSALVLALSGAGAASAGSPPVQHLQLGSSLTSPRAPSFLAPYFKPALDYLKIDLPTLVQELKSGKSLGDIAVAHGGTADGLTSAILAPIQTRLDDAVTAGWLTATQRDALVPKLQAALTRLVAAKPKPRG